MSDQTEPVVNRDREYEESVSVFRGLIIATAMSIPIWALVALGIWAVVR